MVLFLSLLNVAEAVPYDGFRASVCMGTGSDCPVVQLGVGYANERIGVNIKAFPAMPYGGSLNLNHYTDNPEDKHRSFIGTSIGASLSSIYNFIGVGLHLGMDYHLLNSKRLVITPKFGVDLGYQLDAKPLQYWTPLNGDFFIGPSVSVETALTF